MRSQELANDTADLLSLAHASQPRSLNQLVTMATRQVRACSGATAASWHDDELTMMVASHPDLPELVEVQLRSGHGPVVEALASGELVSVPDTLTETRWPQYASAALRRGVRCSLTLASRRDRQAVTLSLFGARPRLLQSGQLDLAELLITYGRAVVGNAADYGDAQRTALQLRDAVEARALVDQATGMLMQALGCTADEAMRWLRRNSQDRNIRVAEVARRILTARSADSLD